MGHSRARKILLAVGVAVATGVVAVFLSVLSIKSALSSSGANKSALAALRGNEGAAKVLGEVKSVGWPVGDVSSDRSGAGLATLYMKVDGTKGSGNYFATLVRKNGTWVLLSGRVDLSDGRSVEIDGRAPK